MLRVPAVAGLLDRGIAKSQLKMLVSSSIFYKLVILLKFCKLSKTQISIM